MRVKYSTKLNNWNSDEGHRQTKCKVAIVAVKTQQCILCVTELHVTVNYVKILSVAQQCFYGFILVFFFLK